MTDTDPLTNNATRPDFQTWAPWLLLAIVALLVRWPGLSGPFDREFDGFQGGFFATTAVNYERLGVTAADLYPVANVSLDPDRPETWYVYPNHPPTVPLMAWASARCLGPEGWRTSWRDARAPQNLEFSLRLPFALMQLATALGLGVLFASCGCRAMGLLAVTAFLFAPISIGYAGLVNYEHPAMAAAVWTLVAAVRWSRQPSRSALLLCALGAALGTSVTFAPAFFLPGIVLVGLMVQGRCAWRLAAALGIGALLPILLHRHFGGAVLREFGLSPDPLFARVRRLLAPLLDGTLPFDQWLAIQWSSGIDYWGATWILLGGVGLISAVLLMARTSDPLRRLAAGASLALLSGGALAHVAFYKHTGDPQPSFLLNLTPGLAALIGLGLGNWVERNWPSRVALGSLVPAIVLAVVGSWGGDALTRPWRAPVGEPDAPSIPLPPVIGREVAARVPADSAVWYPDQLGLNPAAFFYAWRTMLPVAASDSSYSMAQGQLERFAQGDHPLVLALPTNAPPRVLQQSAQLEARLASQYPEIHAHPLVDDDRWRVFRLR